MDNVRTLCGGVHRTLGGKTGYSQHRALGGLHNSLVGCPHTLLHCGGEGGGIGGPKTGKISAIWIFHWAGTAPACRAALCRNSTITAPAWNRGPIG